MIRGDGLGAITPPPSRNRTGDDVKTSGTLPGNVMICHIYQVKVKSDYPLENTVFFGISEALESLILLRIYY